MWGMTFDKSLRMFDPKHMNKEPAASSEERLKKLLREAVKIIHCHARNTNKDWLARARAELREKP